MNGDGEPRLWADWSIQTSKPVHDLLIERLSDTPPGQSRPSSYKDLNVRTGFLTQEDGRVIIHELYIALDPETMRPFQMQTNVGRLDDYMGVIPPEMLTMLDGALTTIESRGQ